MTPVVTAHPDEFQSLLALGKALVREGRPEEGLKRLQEAQPPPTRRPACSADATLSALEDTGQFEAVERAIDRIPVNRGRRPFWPPSGPDRPATRAMEGGHPELPDRA